MDWLLKLMLPALLDALIEALAVLAANTSTDVDDNLVKTVRENKEELIKEIYKHL